jgi:hypothetical protein
MEFTRISFAIIEDYVLASVIINMVLVAEIRFYPSKNGVQVYQKEDNWVFCSDKNMHAIIWRKANEYAKQHNLIKDIDDEDEK